MKLKKTEVLDFLKETIYSNTFFYTGFSVFANGMDKTSLELIQMGKRNKIKKRLKKRYKKLLKTPLDTVQSTTTGDVIWTSWLQGETQAPLIVQNAIQSLRDNFPNKRVIVVDQDNLEKYVSFPREIIEKWKNGVISNAHFSDLLRLYLLINYGGIWIDATVFVKEVPVDLLDEVNTGLFFFQNLRPGQSGNAIWLSSWFLSARQDEPVLKRTYELLIRYWEKNNQLIDYFLFHIFLHLVLEENPTIMDSIKKVPNSLPLMLMYRLRDTEDRNVISNIFNEYPIQKVTYKSMPNKDSNYNFLECSENVAQMCK